MRKGFKLPVVQSKSQSRCAEGCEFDSVHHHRLAWTLAWADHAAAQPRPNTDHGMLTDHGTARGLALEKPLYHRPGVSEGCCSEVHSLEGSLESRARQNSCRLVRPRTW